MCVCLVSVCVLPLNGGPVEGNGGDVAPPTRRRRLFVEHHNNNNGHSMYV